MTYSHLDSTPAELLAAIATANGVAGVSALTHSPEQLVAATANELGENVSALTNSYAELLAAYATAVGGSGSALTSSPDQLLAIAVNALGGTGSALTHPTGELLASCANLSQGGGGDYTAQAIHFDGSANLNCLSLTCTDNEFISFSFWIKASAEDYDSGGVLWVADSETYTTWAQSDGTSGSLATCQFNTSDNGSNNGVISTRDSIGTNLIPVDTWTHVIGSFKTNASQIGKLYVSGVEATLPAVFSGSAFVNAYNGLPFMFGDDGFGDGFTGDFADVWIAPGVSLLTAGDISPATLALFRDGDGKPVNPSGFASSAILFSGDHTTFATNQGTGGSFSLTGSLTNASTSPSD